MMTAMSIKEQLHLRQLQLQLQQQQKQQQQQQQQQQQWRLQQLDIFHQAQPDKPPEGCASDAVKLFVGNIPRSYTEHRLMPLFETVGHVVELVVVRDKSTHKSKGSAFVWYETQEEAERAILHFDERCVLSDPHSRQGASRPLAVRRALPRAKQPGSPIGPAPAAGAPTSQLPQQNIWSNVLNESHGCESNFLELLCHGGGHEGSCSSSSSLSIAAAAATDRTSPTLLHAPHGLLAPYLMGSALEPDAGTGPAADGPSYHGQLEMGRFPAGGAAAQPSCEAAAPATPQNTPKGGQQGLMRSTSLDGGVAPELVLFQGNGAYAPAPGAQGGSFGDTSAFGGSLAGTTTSTAVIDPQQFFAIQAQLFTIQAMSGAAIQVAPSPGLLGMFQLFVTGTPSQIRAATDLMCLVLGN